MSTDAKSGSGSHTDAGGTPGPSRRHFDTFETKFFEQGDEVPPLEAEHFDDLDDGKARRFAPSRQLLVGVALGSACVAILGCVALWRSGGHSSPPVASPPAAAPAAMAPAPGTTAAPAQAGPAVVPAAPAAVALAPAAAMEARPTATLAAVAAPGAPAPTAAAPAAPAEEPSLPAAAGAAGEAQAACQKAIHDKRYKETLSACTRAFDDDPSAGEAALAVARAEFDRGHSAQALVWGRRAVAIDPNAADAYVFIGGAEQSAGHGKAAKDAFQRYLQLAPAGRYAADLRAIVGRL